MHCSRSFASRASSLAWHIYEKTTFDLLMHSNVVLTYRSDGRSRHEKDIMVCSDSGLIMMSL